MIRDRSRANASALCTVIPVVCAIAWSGCGSSQPVANSAGAEAIPVTAGNQSVVAAGGGSVPVAAGRSGAAPPAGPAAPGSTTCGAATQACCTGNMCNAGTRCLQGMCFACGAPGLQCCNGNSCTTGCCVSSVCLAPGASCGMSGGTCNPDGCSTCGGAAEACCPGGGCHNGLACNGGGGATTTPAPGIPGIPGVPGVPVPGAGGGGGMTCSACGHANEMCCPDRICSAGSCVGNTNPVCRDDCGNAAQPCCSLQGGTVCGNGLSCINMMCSRCGGLGEPCCTGGRTPCTGGSVCANQMCSACGKPGQPCCPIAPGEDGCPGPQNNCMMAMCQGNACGTRGDACCAGADGMLTVCGGTGVTCQAGVCM